MLRTAATACMILSLLSACGGKNDELVYEDKTSVGFSGIGTEPSSLPTQRRADVIYIVVEE